MQEDIKRGMGKGGARRDKEGEREKKGRCVKREGEGVREEIKRGRGNEVR